MIKNKIKNVLNVFLSLLLVFYSFAPGLLYAQEATQSAQNPTPSPSASATAASTASPEVSPTPSVEPTVNTSTESAQAASPSPEITPPSGENPSPSTSDNPVSSPNENQEQANAPPTENPSPTASVNPSPSAEPAVNGHLAASVIKGNAPINEISLDINPGNTDSSASLTTDKADYSPTDTAIISGTKFLPTTGYTLIISSQDSPAVNFETEVTTDDKGFFIYSYQLDGNYRPNYKAEAKDQNGNVVASVLFTDTDATCTTPPSGMTSWWPGEDNANDIVGTNNGSLVGGVTYAAGKVGQAFSFDGTDDYIEMPNSVGDFGSNPFTVDFWMYNSDTDLTRGHYILGKSYPDGGEGWDIRYYNNTITVEGWSFEITSAITLDTWHHIAVSATVSDVTLYIDGVVKGTSGRPASITSTTNPFRIGYTTGFWPYTNVGFNGLIDEVEIFDRALSQDEINAIYNADSAGKCKEDSTPTGTITIEKVVEGGDVSSSNWYFNILGDEGTVASELYDGDSVELPTGTYTISESTINGYVLTGATGVCSDFDGSNATLTVTEEGGTCTLTNTKDPVSVLGFKYFDVDQNGSYDGEDYPLENWTLCLNPDGNNQGYPVSPSECQTTGADGFVEWTVPTGPAYDSEGFGAYHGLYMQESNQDGWTQTSPPNAGFNVDISLNERGEVLYRYYDGEQSQYVTTPEFGNWQDSNTDTTPPELTSAETKDTDENGQIDAVELTFTEDIDDSLLDTSSSDGWDADGYDNEIISTGQTDNDNTLLLTFSESGQSDTATTPYISYTPSGDGDLTSTHDLAGNELESGTWGTSDGAAPVSTFFSPEEGSFWNELIDISGSSSDNDILGESDTVDYVTLYYSLAGEDEWEEIDQIYNEGDEPFEWDSSWEPEEEGTYDFKAEATDISGNTEQSPVVRNVVYDTTKPESDITYPEEALNYSQGQWDGEILAEADDPLSGIAGMLISVQRDADNKYWDGDDDEDGTGWRSSEDEYLNQATLGENGAWSFGFDFIEPEGADEGYTARSHAVDNAGNREDTAEVHFYFGRPPVISGEAESSVTQTSATITWTTDFPATSRVLYDTVSHPALGEAPNYGYANSTVESDTDPKVTSHSVLVSGLTAGTTYYYRTVSHGSPEAAGDEKSFKTLSATSTTTNTGNGTGDGLSDGLGCGSHDCSGNIIGIVAPAVLAIQPQTPVFSLALSELPEEVLGATAETGESPDDLVVEEVKGEQTVAEEPVKKGSLFGGMFQNSFGLIILIILIMLTYFIYRRLNRKGQG